MRGGLRLLGTEHLEDLTSSRDQVGDLDVVVGYRSRRGLGAKARLPNCDGLLRVAPATLEPHVAETLCQLVGQGLGSLQLCRLVLKVLA